MIPFRIFQGVIFQNVVTFRVENPQIFSQTTKDSPMMFWFKIYVVFPMFLKEFRTFSSRTNFKEELRHFPESVPNHLFELIFLPDVFDSLPMLLLASLIRIYRSLMILRPSHLKHNNKSRLPTLKSVPPMNLEAFPWIPTQHIPENHLEPSTIATNCPWSSPKCLMSWLMSVLCLNRIHPPHDCWNHPKPKKPS